MAAGFGELTMNNPVFATYLFYAALIGLKMIMMSVFTARHRMGKKVFANPEDASAGQGKVKLDDPDVERVRRAHLNDMENILPFLALCPLYLATGPSAWLATNLIRGFAAARIAHTFFYLHVIPQPSRGAAFFVGFLINIYMCIHIIRVTM